MTGDRRDELRLSRPVSGSGPTGPPDRDGRRRLAIVTLAETVPNSPLAVRTASDLLHAERLDEPARRQLYESAAESLPDLDDPQGDPVRYWALSAVCSALEAPTTGERELNVAAESLAALSAHLFLDQTIKFATGEDLPESLQREWAAQLRGLGMASTLGPTTSPKDLFNLLRASDPVELHIVDGMPTKPSIQ